MIKKFTKEDLKKLWKPREDSSGEDNGQVTIIGGSKLFHGAPIFAMKAASRMVDMTFFASPEPCLGVVAAQIKAANNAFIWVNWENVEEYIAKSDAILIGPGLMRYHTGKPDGEVFDEAGTLTRSVTKYLLQKYSDKRWVIDGGSLQVMDKAWIPEGAVLTPNKHEMEMLFGTSPSDPSPNFGEGGVEYLEMIARDRQCVIVHKGPVSYVTDGEITYEVGGGNAGLTKGGTGDTLAGIIVGLLAKNPPILAAAAGNYLIKKTAEELEKEVGLNFNADDVSEQVFRTWQALLRDDS